MVEVNSFEGRFNNEIQRIAFVRKMIGRPSFQVGRLFLERGGLRACLKTWFFVISTEAKEVSEVEKSLL